jgi:hypothetical protein
MHGDRIPLLNYWKLQETPGQPRDLSFWKAKSMGTLICHAR